MCFRHDEDDLNQSTYRPKISGASKHDLFEPKYLGVSLGVKLLEQTGAISAHYVNQIVARHVLDRCYRSAHPIDSTKPCRENGANAISVNSEFALRIIVIQLPEED